MDEHSMLEYENNFDKHADVASERLYGEQKNEVAVSIVIPAYKRQNLLKEAISSAIDQNYVGDYEVVIIDNTDDDSFYDTIEWLKRKNDEHIVYYHNIKNIGMFGNWNRGIELANGKWIVILNSDDLLHKDYLRIMMSYARELPDDTSLICCNHYDMIDGIIQRQELSNRKSFIREVSQGKAILVNQRDMYFGLYISLVGALIKRKYAIEIGGFKEKYYPTSDYVYIMNNSFAGYKIYHLQFNLAVYRIEANESLKFQTVELFMQHQNEAKKMIQKQKRYLPAKISECFRNVSLFTFEKQLTEKWVKDENSYRQRIRELNNKINVQTPSNFSLIIFKLFNKIKYWEYVVLRNYIRVHIYSESKNK